MNEGERQKEMNSREGGWTDETGGEKGMERGKEERERER